MTETKRPTFHNFNEDHNHAGSGNLLEGSSSDSFKILNQLPQHQEYRTQICLSFLMFK